MQIQLSKQKHYSATLNFRMFLNVRYFQTDSCTRRVITLVFAAAWVACAGGALRLASQERATAVTQRLSWTEMTRDLQLYQKHKFSVAEITSHRSLQNFPASPISVNSLHYCLYLGGDDFLLLSANGAQTIHRSVLSVKDTNTHFHSRL